MSLKVKAFFSLLLFASCLSGYTQTPGSRPNDLNVNSPYSRLGIGDLSFQGNVRNMGMGGTGVSYGHPEYINSLNPALLINRRVNRYDSLTTILEASGIAQYRILSTSTASQRSGNVNFNSFAYAFPLNKRWTTSVSLQPYSEVNYSIVKKQAIVNSTDSALYRNIGHGGIYQASISNGVKINQSFSVGLQASYIFGAINKENFNQIIRDPDSLRVGTRERTFYSGFLLRPGVAFQKQITPGAVSDSTVFLNLGLTYDLYANMQGEEKIFIQRKDAYNQIFEQTTLSDTKQHLTFPASYRVGVSFNKQQRWNIGADFSYSNWSGYKGTSSIDTLKNSFTIAVGTEFLTNGKGKVDLVNSKKNYFRAGFSYTKTPYYVNGQSINDVALTLGYTVSVGKAKGNTFSYRRIPLPKFNFALVAGKRGTEESNLVKDIYFKGYIGITINDKWFIRRRID